MKVYIRTLWGNDIVSLWDNTDQREGLRQYLNELGFYVVTGNGDSLEVNVIDYDDPFDIQLIKKSLDKIQKGWYSLINKKGEK